VEHRIIRFVGCRVSSSSSDDDTQEMETFPEYDPSGRKTSVRVVLLVLKVIILILSIAYLYVMGNPEMVLKHMETYFES
jgi:hypothetical protein